MHKLIDKIKKNENKPFVVSNFLNQDEIKLFQKLYNDLPLEIDNKRQQIIKKKWSKNFYPDLQGKYNRGIGTINKIDIILETI